MVRKRIEIKKIESLTARQVTYAKRRRGLLKKAEELATLCDAELGLIVFSATGKLSEYSSSSMQQVLARQNMQSNKMENLDNHHDHAPIELEDNQIHAKLMKDCMDKDRQLRQLMGEDIQELDMDDLITLEKQMERGLSRVLKMKDTIHLNEITALKNQGAFLKEENEQMKHFVHQQMGRGEKPPSDQLVPGQSDNSISEACSPTISQSCHGHSDTSLKLGLPFPTEVTRKWGLTPMI